MIINIVIIIIFGKEKLNMCKKYFVSGPHIGDGSATDNWDSYQKVLFFSLEENNMEIGIIGHTQNSVCTTIAYLIK